MRIEQIGTDVAVTLDEEDTAVFAERWPCSTVAGLEVFARFDRRGDLVDLAVDGARVDVPADELNALVERYVGTPRPTPSDL